MADAINPNSPPEAKRGLRPTDVWSRAEGDAARFLLLEVSPYEADGGELIGRDPRKVSTTDFAAAGLEAAPILKVLRAKCLDCCVGQSEEVRKCVLVTCPNWPYRMGANPFRSRELTDEQRAAASERGKALSWLRTISGQLNNHAPASPPDYGGRDA